MYLHLRNWNSSHSHVPFLSLLLPHPWTHEPPCSLSLSSDRIPRLAVLYGSFLGFIRWNLFLRSLYLACFPTSLLPPSSAGRTLGFFSQYFLSAAIVILRDTDVFRNGSNAKVWPSVQQLGGGGVYGLCRAICKAAKCFCVGFTQKSINHEKNWQLKDSQGYVRGTRQGCVAVCAESCAF